MYYREINFIGNHFLKYVQSIMLRTRLQITFTHSNQKKSFRAEKQKSINNHQIINAFPTVGMTGFEPATTRPPDEYSNRTELHPVCGCKSRNCF